MEKAFFQAQMWTQNMYGSFLRVAAYWFMAAEVEPTIPVDAETENSEDAAEDKMKPPQRTSQQFRLMRRQRIAKTPQWIKRSRRSGRPNNSALYEDRE